MSSDDRYDMVIVGGGPAGCAAALAAQRGGRRALVIERDEQPGDAGCAGWVGPAALQVCGELGADVSGVGRPFAGVHLHAWDFDQTVKVEDAALAGRVVAPAKLSAALQAAVVAQGGALRRSLTVAALELGEREVTATLSDETQVRAGIVLVADGAASATAPLAQLPAARGGEAAAALATFTTADAQDSVHVVLGGLGGLHVATISRCATAARALLVVPRGDRPAEVQLRALLAAAAQAGVVTSPGEVAVRAVPALAGAALEMETHVGKRCLLVGDAGGYVSAFSSEGLYPALRSGVLAADAVDRALAAAVLQDELAAFSTAWRSDLADYLRMPNTDLSLLLPMVFKNQQMSSRVARAFLLGHAF